MTATVTTHPDRVTTDGPAVRLAVDDLGAAAAQALEALDAATRRTELERPLQELVRLRASQINGCGYCVDMHAADALGAGVPQRSLLAVPVWRETPWFTERERAALELTEAMTRLSESAVSDAVFDRAADEFTAQELSDLVWLITVINAWNRLGATAHPWPLS